MVLDIDGVVKVAPVPNELPPVDAAYQLIVPSEAVAPNVTVAVPQTEEGVVPAIVGIGFTVATTAVLEAVVHPELVAST